MLVVSAAVAAFNIIVVFKWSARTVRAAKAARPTRLRPRTRTCRRRRRRRRALLVH